MKHKRKALIVDLDGTLCNVDHRRPLVTNGNNNWKNFFEQMTNDTPNEWCVEICNRFYPMEILFITGRPDSYRQITDEWLGRYHFFEPALLYMRARKDFRADHIVKKEIYEKHIQSKYEILFVVDDRASVVKMWRELGLVCLQCADGDF